MRTLAFLVRLISGVNSFVGHLFSWLSLAIVLVCFTVVVQRYVFAVSFVWLQDLYIWLNGAMFMAVAGFALLKNDHVRVDIFYRPASLRRKAAIDLLGVIVFLLPFCFVVFAYALPFVQRSWGIQEGSGNVGGMPGLFVLKTFIPAFSVLVGLQGLAMAMRSILVLAGREELLPEHLRYERQSPVDEETAL